MRVARPLESSLSATIQQEITARITLQVRRAVELLIARFGRCDRVSGGTLLSGVDEKQIHEAAITVMMRLLFIRRAEICGLLPGHEAWLELKILLRRIHAGSLDPPIANHGGSLLDPDRFPFLKDDALLIDDRIVHHLLGALEASHEGRLISFSDLDVEQIGHVYEGLLDRVVVRAEGPVLGLMGKYEPAVELDRLEELRTGGDEKLLAFLAEITGRKCSVLRRSSTRVGGFIAWPLPDGEALAKLRTACDGDEALCSRVIPFAGLLRDDLLGHPLVYAGGSLYVTYGDGRWASGSHYTPRKLTGPIVRHTLESLVYDGPTDGAPREEWKLKPTHELLNIKVCDLAMGGGAFLIEACRYLSERLVESGEQEHAVHRLVAERCLYGVDKDPLAVEIAKISLWFLVAQKDCPLSFLDHPLKAGDSLVGVHDRQQLRRCHLRPERSEVDLPASVPLPDEALRSLGDLIVGGQLMVLRKETPLRYDALMRRWGAEEIVPALTAEPTGQVGRMRELRERVPVHDEDRFFHWPLEFPEVFSGDRPGFDAIIGNPPFVNVISGRISEAARKYALLMNPELEGTADYSFFFLSHAQKLVRDGGRIGLLMPRNLLNASAAKRLRENLATVGVSMICAPKRGDIFSGASVFVCWIIIGKSATTWITQGLDAFPQGWVSRSIADANWWTLLQEHQGPEANTVGSYVRDHFLVNASMTAGDAYDLIPHLVDGEEEPGAKLATTGLIDPRVCHWGAKRCRYLKTDYLFPRVIESDAITKSLRRRLADSRRPKVIVAGLSRNPECFLDESGEYIGAVSTYSIFHPGDDVGELRRLAEVILSEETAARFRAVLGGNAMGGGNTTMKREFLRSLRLGEKWMTEAEGPKGHQGPKGRR